MAMTPAEKMRAYRLRQKEKGFKQVNSWVQADGTETAGAAEPGSAESRRAQWEAELQAEKLKAARAEGRKLARQKDKTQRNGYINGLCTAAAFFVSHDRHDIAQHLLQHFMIDRESAEGALQADRRVKSITLETLDRAGAWDKPPPLTLS